MKRNVRDIIFLTIRVTLLASILLNIALFIATLLRNAGQETSEIFSLYSKNFEFIFCAPIKNGIYLIRKY
ncbi:hypothetical protein FACS189450_11220 [Spirochaetia bacterium]|nr:hypothetical protein FACS189450_11220 [Spirochaetia bacterium]